VLRVGQEAHELHVHLGKVSVSGNWRRNWSKKWSRAGVGAGEGMKLSPAQFMLQLVDDSGVDPYFFFCSLLHY